MNYLNPTSFYVNPPTQSVLSGKDWMDSFSSREDLEMNWEEWGGDSLIEVELNDAGDWEES